MAQLRKQEFDIHNIEAYPVGSIIEDISDGDTFEREGEFKYQTYQDKDRLSQTNDLVWLATNEVAAQRNAKLTKELGDSVFSGALSHQYAAETVVLKFAQGSMDKLRAKTQNEWIAMSMLANSTHAGARHIIKPLNYVYASTCAQLIENNQGENEWERLGHNAFIVMPYVQGQRLFNMVKDLPECNLERLSQVENYCQQLSTILSLLASTDTPVVHRDISPNNLLVDENKQLVLIDFDRCVLLGGSTQTVTEAGTPGYQSPEVDAKRTDVDSRADQYSIAAIIFNLLTGEVPDYRGDAALFAQIKVELSDKKRDFIEWIKPLSKAMSVEKEERYANAQDFEQAIKQAFSDYYARITFNPYQEAKRSLSHAENELNALAQQLSLGIKTEQKDKEQVENIQTLVNAFNATHSKTNNKILNNKLLTELLTELNSHENSQGEWISQAQSTQAQLKQQLSNIARQIHTLTKLEQQASLSKQLPEELIDIQQGIKDTFWVESQEQTQAVLAKQYTSQQVQIQLQQNIDQALSQPEDTVTTQDNIASQSTAVLTQLSQKLQQQQAKLSGDRAHNSQQVLRNLSTYLVDVESKHSKLNSATQAHHSQQQSLIKQIASLANTDTAEQSERAKQVGGLDKLSQTLEQLLTYQQNQELLTSQYQALLNYAWHNPGYWQKEWKTATKQKLAGKALVTIAIASSVGAIAYWSPFANSGPEVKSSITRTYQNEEVKILLNRELEPGGYQLSFTGANCDYKQSKSHKMSNVNQRGYVYFTCTADKFGEHAYKLLTPQGKTIQTKRDSITVKPLKHKLSLQVEPEHANVQAIKKSNNKTLTLTSGIRLYEGEYQLSSTAKDYHDKSETIEWLGQPLSINLEVIDNQAPEITLTNIKQIDELLTLTVNAKDNKALKKLSVQVKQGETVVGGTSQNWLLHEKTSSSIDWQYDLTKLSSDSYIAVFEVEDSNGNKRINEHVFEFSYIALADKYYETEGDNDKAFKFYQLAAKQGHVKAFNRLGVMYRNGEGVSENLHLAKGWFQKAAEKGDKVGQRMMAVMHYWGRNKSESDHITAFKLLKKSAVQGDRVAQWFLSLCYTDGKGVNQNKELANKWRQKSLEFEIGTLAELPEYRYRIGSDPYYVKAWKIKRDTTAPYEQIKNGIMYANGVKGTPVNYQLAIEWFQKAAKQGDLTAIKNLAFMYERGIGVVKNKTKALNLYQQAIDKGHKSSVEKVKRVEKSIANLTVESEEYIPTINFIHGWTLNEVKSLQIQVAKKLGVPVVFRDKRNTTHQNSFGPRMVVIPEGGFVMGCVISDDDCRKGLPNLTITHSKPFAVSETEITFNDWKYCVDDGGCKSNTHPYDSNWALGLRPAKNISFDDAIEYVTWLTQSTGYRYRLLTEAEWEYSARAGTDTIFPWGNKVSCEDARYGDSFSGDYECPKGDTFPVKSFKPNNFGLFDMVGNINEIVSTCTYSGYSPFVLYKNGTKQLKGEECQDFITKGGGASSPKYALRPSYKGGMYRDVRWSSVGLRVARDFELNVKSVSNDLSPKFSGDYLVQFDKKNKTPINTNKLKKHAAILKNNYWLKLTLEGYVKKQNGEFKRTIVSDKTTNKIINFMRMEGVKQKTLVNISPDNLNGEERIGGFGDFFIHFKYLD